MRYIVALDEGTTSVRAVLYDTHTHSIKKIEKQRFKQIFPASGLVEHDANMIWNKQINSLKKLTTDIDPKEIYGICRLAMQKNSEPLQKTFERQRTLQKNKTKNWTFARCIF